MTVIYHKAQIFMLRWGLRNVFYLGWPGTAILPISASHVTWVTGASDCTQLLVEMGV
jgi:hypothetical protein